MATITGFFETILQMFMLLPDGIKALIAIIMAIMVFFGIMQMIRT